MARQPTDLRDVVFAAAKHATVAVLSLLVFAALTLGITAGTAARKNDRVPPSAPGNIHVASATATGLLVEWEPATDENGVSGYYVYRDTGRATVTRPTYLVAGLGCGESSTLAVAAYDAAGNKSRRVYATVSTPACSDLQPPSAPAGLRQSAASTNAVVLVWEPSADNVAVVGYGVYHGMARITSTAEPTATVTGLECGSSYVLTVDAVDAAGNRSVQATAYVRTAGCADTEAPSRPTSLTIRDRSASALTAEWVPSNDDVGVAGYEVGIDGMLRAVVTSTTASISGLACGTSYAVSVTAFDSVGNRSAPASVTAATESCQVQDSTPPTTPSGLVASSISQSGMVLTWTAASDNVAVLQYEVSRNGSRVATVMTTTYVQSGGLACGTAYDFGVRARDTAGNVSAEARITVSTAACSQPPADTTPPSIPQSLVVSSVTQTTATLSWGAATDDVQVTGYRVFVDGTLQATTSLRSATVGGFSCGTLHTFTVEAFDAAGNRSVPASVTGSTAACPDAQPPSVPMNVVVAARSATSIALSWSPASDNVGVAGYGLYLGGQRVATTTSTTGIFSGLTCNANYTLGVDAFDAVGNRSTQAVLLVATTSCPDTTPPSTPSGLAAGSISQTGLTVSWNASSDNVGVVAYDVFRGGTRVSTVTTLSSTQTGLACATSYTFGVEALDAAGNRSPRAQLTVSTAACSTPPAPPPPSGTSISTFTDLANARFGDTLINRWQVPFGANPWSSPTDTGVPWPSGGGIWEVSTSHGPGFKFVSTAEMAVASGGKKAEMADIDHLVKVGVAQVWSGKFMFPSGGNPNGFPAGHNSWNLIWELHDAGNVLQWGVNTDPGAGLGPTPNIYFRSAGPSWNEHRASTSALAFDRWYDWRVEVKLSTGTDGYVRAYLDGQLIASRTGPVMNAGQAPYLQLGFYGPAMLRNEVWFAQLSVS